MLLLYILALLLSDQSVIPGLVAVQSPQRWHVMYVTGLIVVTAEEGGRDHVIATIN